MGRATALAAAFARAKPAKLYPGATGVFEARAYFDPETRKWRAAARYVAGQADVPLGGLTGRQVTVPLGGGEPHGAGGRCRGAA